jgi:phage major head subunit gpT-like protein
MERPFAFRATLTPESPEPPLKTAETRLIFEGCREGSIRRARDPRNMHTPLRVERPIPPLVGSSHNRRHHCRRDMEPAQMLINATALDLVYKGFKQVYTDAFLAAPEEADKIVMTVPSAAREEQYGWLGTLPSLREWIGPRHVNGLKAHGFTIVNKKFESTVSVKRDDISDDRLGVFKPFFSEMGQTTRRHKEELVFGLLKAGFTAPGYDGQSFFDTDHPIEIDGETVTVANTDGGSGAAWFLLDTSRAVRPIIWQEREGYEFTSINRAEDQHVFLNDEFIYGVRARVNAGFGLWQLAWGSKQPLNAANYATARAAMMGFRGDGGKLLGVKPNVLVVPPVLEEAALKLVNSEYGTGGESNPWKGTAEPIVTSYVA